MFPDRQLAVLLSWQAIVFALLLGGVPILFPFLSHWEGRILPVVENVRVEPVAPTFYDDFPAHVEVMVSFDKVRSCEFIGLSWYDQQGVRVPLAWEATASVTGPTSRPVKDNQKTGPWSLFGIDSLKGSIAIVSHRCHPLWITYTPFYP